MVDVIIILLLLMGIIVGAKKGFTSQLVDTVGYIIIIVLSFLFKGYVSGFLYIVMPFFNFSGKFAGVTSLNILLYEVVAFFVIFIVLSGILAIIKYTTSVFEKFLKATIILGIPSKILGAVVGLINNIIIIFVAVYFLRSPMFDLEPVKDSKMADAILNNTPGLSQVCDKTIKVFDDIEHLVDEYKNDTNVDELNQRTLQLLVGDNIVSRKTANDLIARGKLKGVTPIKG